jgi:hypothetical protein
MRADKVVDFDGLFFADEGYHADAQRLACIVVLHSAALVSLSPSIRAVAVFQEISFPRAICGLVLDGNVGRLFCVWHVDAFRHHESRKAKFSHLAIVFLIALVVAALCGACVGLVLGFFIARWVNRQVGIPQQLVGGLPEAGPPSLGMS